MRRRLGEFLAGISSEIPCIYRSSSAAVRLPSPHLHPFAFVLGVFGLDVSLSGESSFDFGAGRSDLLNEAPAMSSASLANLGGTEEQGIDRVRFAGPNRASKR